MTAPDDEDESASKKFKWEDPSNSTAQPLSGVKSRWSAATPRQYTSSDATPRMRSAGGGFEGGWRGLATPSATPQGGEEVGTPRFGHAASRVGGSGGFATPLQAGGTTPRAMMGAAGQTPQFIGQTPRAGASTPSALGGVFGATPSFQFEGTTPLHSHYTTGPTTAAAGVDGGASSATNLVEQKALEMEKEWRVKNKRLTEEALDALLPAAEYFEVIPPPPDYNPPLPEEPNFYEAAIQAMTAAGDVMGGGGAAGGPQTFEIPESLGVGMPEMTPADAPVFVELLQYAGREEQNIPAEALLSYLLMKNLFKLKNGDNSQRRAGTRFLLSKSHVFGAKLIFSRIFVVWSANVLDVRQKHNFIEFCKALISHLGVGVRKSCVEVVHMMEPLLTAQEAVIREDGKQALILLTRVAGFQTVWNTIQADFSHEDYSIRRHTAKVVAIITVAVGLEEPLEEIKKLSYDISTLARQTTARAMGEICALLGHAVLGGLSEMVSVLDRLIRDDKRVARDAAASIAMIAEACAPYGKDELSAVVNVVFEECQRGIGSTATPFLRAFGALLPFMAAEEVRRCTTILLPILVNQFNSPEDEYKRTMLTVVQKCMAAQGVTTAMIRETLLEPFFEGFWKAQRLVADKKNAAALLDTTVVMAEKIGATDMLLRLSKEMTSDSDVMQRLVLNAVTRIVKAQGMEEVSAALVSFLMEKLIFVVQQDEVGVNKNAVDALCAVCNALGARLKPHLKDVFGVVHRRRESREPAVRAQAAEFTGRVARAVMKAEGAVFLQEIGSSLFNRMEDSEGVVLSANLRATRIILDVLGCEKYRPSVRELLKKLTFVIKNSFSSVQQNAVALIEDIATNYDSEVDAIHLHQLATRGLFELLDADRRETRRVVARTFAAIASKISPFTIILELVDNFRQDKRKIRICTAVALGAIAKVCGPFTVLPYVLNEYQISEGEQVAVIVQHATLKAIRYIFEFIGAAGEDYVLCCVPLLQRALTETSVQMRRMAIEAARAVLMAVAGLDGFREVTIHLLNFVHPNIVELLAKKEVKVGEERLKIITATVSFYEAAQLHVGSGVMYAYLVQGLFHPARLVRDIYRRAYNTLYWVGGPENLIPYYAPMEDGPATESGGDASHLRFRRYELEVPF